MEKQYSMFKSPADGHFKCQEIYGGNTFQYEISDVEEVVKKV
jgi:hypothetical protein